MAKDDILLGVEIGKLEIQPVKVNTIIKEENPFVPVSLPTQNKSLFARICQRNSKCSCGSQKLLNLSISKKKPKKILKEPILKLFQLNEQTYVKGECHYVCSKSTPIPTECSDILSLCALVDNCNQLKISSDANDQTLNTQKRNENQWWKKTKLFTTRSSETSSGVPQAGTCSQQALNPPCDVTIDELASYFETLVHIPKKMSSMAEMMYI